MLIDQYTAITFAIKYRSNLTSRKCGIGSFIIWLVSLSLPFIIFKTGYIQFLMIYINTGGVIAGIILTTVCIHINKFLGAQTQQMKKITRTTATDTKIFEFKRTFQKNRVTRLVLWILILFLVCYIPDAIIVYMLQFCKTYNCESIQIMKDINVYLLTVNSCMNPFAHAFKNKHYRLALAELWAHIKKKLSMLWYFTTSRNNTISLVEKNIDMNYN